MGEVLNADLVDASNLLAASSIDLPRSHHVSRVRAACLYWIAEEVHVDIGEVHSIMDLGPQHKTACTNGADQVQSTEDCCKHQEGCHACCAIYTRTAWLVFRAQVGL